MAIYYRRKQIEDPFNPDEKKIEKLEIESPGTVNLDDICREVAKLTNKPEKMYKEVLEKYLESCREHLEKGYSVPLFTFGSLVPVERKIKVPSKDGKGQRTVKVKEIEFVPSEEFEKEMNDVELIELKEGEELPLVDKEALAEKFEEKMKKDSPDSLFKL